MRAASAAIVLAVLTLDQAIKAMISRTIPLGASCPILPPVLYVTHLRNPGIAFSALPEIPLVVPALIALILVGLLFSERSHWPRRRSAKWGLALLAGGAIGNLIDRMRLGAVIDYLDLRVWPVFNLADLAITVGAALLILTFALRPRVQGARGGG